MDVSVDTHQCIRCGQTIVGIDAYVEHRKYYCLESHSPVLEREPLEPSLLPDVPDLQDLFVSFLDLQRKPVEPLESGSEDDDDPLRPPKDHTGGKWKPGCRPSIMQGMHNLQRDRTPSPERLPLMLEKMGCAPCGRIFRDKYTYQRHLESSLHRKRSLRNAQILRTQVTEPVIEPKLPEILLEDTPKEQDVKTRKRRRTAAISLESHAPPQKRVYKHRFRCSICFRWFLDKKRLNLHMSKHKSFDGQDFRCSQCQERFPDGTTLREHLKTHKDHRVCCGKTFSTLKGYREHKESIHAAITEWLDCEKCSGKFRTQRAFRDHRCQSCMEEFPCLTCDYVGNSKRNLELHIRTHGQEKRFKCNLCDYHAARHSQLWRHKKIHDAQKLHRCPYCDYTCALIENLRAHILRGTKHAGLKVYPCSKCPFSTNSSSEAKTHRATCQSAT